MKTILILGGYGQTGRLLAHYLLDETECRLIPVSYTHLTLPTSDLV